MELKLVDTVYTNAPKDFAPTRITTYSNSSKGGILAHTSNIATGEMIEIHIYSAGGPHGHDLYSSLFSKPKLPRKLKKKLYGKR